jgi:hypothetical protein
LIVFFWRWNVFRQVNQTKILPLYMPARAASWIPPYARYSVQRGQKQKLGDSISERQADRTSEGNTPRARIFTF